YKPVDYKHLYELAAEAKMASAQIQLKIKKAEQVSKISKEQMLLKQHRQVWWQEYKRLSESLDLHSTCCGTSFVCLRKLYVLTEQKLCKEWDTYQTNALAPVWQLKEDLKLKLSQVQRYLSKESCQKPKINSAEVLQQVGVLTLFLQFRLIEGVNTMPSSALSSISSLQALEHSPEDKNGLFLEVPPELVSLECPYPDLKECIAGGCVASLGTEQWQELQRLS
uniref:Coiled-coil domain containing 148 n=1 Tax=Junco hyemalis TaxID=40217 RepID=A0A8C5J1T1_JUNHY